MLRKIKKYLITFSIVSFSALILLQSISYASERTLTKKEILSMSQTAILNDIEKSGIEIPAYYSNHRDIAERFIKKYTPRLMEKEINADNSNFNYMPSNKMLKNLETYLIKKGALIKNNYSTRSSWGYSLQDSTVLESWDPSHENYNCYAYAIGIWRWRDPDGGAYNYDISKHISNMADDVLEDLQNFGYWGYKTATKPKSLPDKYFKVICIRKDSDDIDYHFMKAVDSSLNSWTHKPSKTQPLSWNYSSPERKAWTNEAVYKNIAYEPTVTYDSQVYYIVFKNKTDPGIHPYSIRKQIH